MKIIKTFNWNRRDFSATLECEGCGHIQDRTGCYDDDHFHQKVIPAIDCGKCGKSTDSLGVAPQPHELKYSPHQIV